MSISAVYTTLLENNKKFHESLIMFYGYFYTVIDSLYGLKLLTLHVMNTV